MAAARRGCATLARLNGSLQFEIRGICSLLERSEKAVGLEALVISRERISIDTCLHPVHHNPGSLIFSVKHIAMNRFWVLFELADIHKPTPTGRGRFPQQVKP
jgi:hypothetical protein